MKKTVVDQAEDASTGMVLVGPEGSGIMRQIEGCGFTCCAVGFSYDCKVVGFGELVEFVCFSFLLVGVVADEPFCIPSCASVVAIEWVMVGCVCPWDCRMLVEVFSVLYCCVLRCDGVGVLVVVVRCFLAIGVDVCFCCYCMFLLILLYGVVAFVVRVAVKLCSPGV